MKRYKHLCYLNSVVSVVTAGTLTLGLMADAVAGGDRQSTGRPIANIQVGSDLNSAENPFVQPQDPALSGGGRDQSLQFGDVLRGSKKDDLQIGRLGSDVIAGNRGDDVMIGGLEHFNPLNRDRAFGGRGNDIFIWKPGDGSDLFEGSRGYDVVVFGNVGEVVNGNLDFGVSQDQQAGEVAINPETGLPLVDVSGSPGFCEVIDSSSSDEAYQALQDLQLDHLVRFSIRGIRDNFEAGGETGDDNGLRVTLHLKNVETLVCTNRAGGAVEVLDLTTTPPTPISLDDILPKRLRNRLNAMVF